MSNQSNRPLRILWVCSHRIHRYEEVTALLRAGAEVIPVRQLNSEYPNAIDLEENSDYLYPDWRQSCSIPEDLVERIRNIPYFDSHNYLSNADKDLLNKWVDVILVASFTTIIVRFIKWFKGYIILRAFGGYPYGGVLKPWSFVGHRNLNYIAHSQNYYWSPILPYLSTAQDARLTRNETVIPAFVSKERLPYEWSAEASEEVVCDVISLIERYRLEIYHNYINSFGALPLKIFGINEKFNQLADDKRVVGTLEDKEFYKQICSCRLMLYIGLNTKYHLHYHPLEALMMKVPLIYFSNGAIAHHARYYGLSDDYLKDAGMCYSREDALVLANKCLRSTGYSIELSQRQSQLRELFHPNCAYPAIAEFVDKLKLKRNYEVSYEDSSKKTYSGLKSIIKNTLPSVYQFITG